MYLLIHRVHRPVAVLGLIRGAHHRRVDRGFHLPEALLVVVVKAFTGVVPFALASFFGGKMLPKFRPRVLFIRETLGKRSDMQNHLPELLLKLYGTTPPPPPPAGPTSPPSWLAAEDTESYILVAAAVGTVILIVVIMCLSCCKPR